MIKFFHDIKIKKSDDITEMLLAGIKNTRFKNEDEVLDFAELVDNKFGEVIILSDFLYLLDVAFEQIEE